MRRYSTFEEVDRDLKYLRLKSQISKEEITISIDNVKDSLSPLNLIANTVGAILKKAFVFKMVDKLIGIKPVKKKEYDSDGKTL